MCNYPDSVSYNQHPKAPKVYSHGFDTPIISRILDDISGRICDRALEIAIERSPQNTILYDGSDFLLLTIDDYKQAAQEIAPNSAQ